MMEACIFVVRLAGIKLLVNSAYEDRTLLIKRANYVTKL
jgi:hypothetical protein